MSSLLVAPSEDTRPACTVYALWVRAAVRRRLSFVKAGVVARNVSVVITDDMDGSAGAETVAFGLDGVSYEIDLAQPNRVRLAGALAPFIEAGRRISRGADRRSSGPAGRPRADRAEVRAWARQAGLEISERGRISAEVMSQYEAAH